MLARAEQIGGLAHHQSMRRSPRQLLRLQLDSESQPPFKATEAAQLLLAANWGYGVGETKAPGGRSRKVGRWPKYDLIHCTTYNYNTAITLHIIDLWCDLLTIIPLIHSDSAAWDFVLVCPAHDALKAIDWRIKALHMHFTHLYQSYIYLCTHVYLCLPITTCVHLCIYTYVYIHRHYPRVASRCIMLIWRYWHETSLDQLRWQCHRVFLYYLCEAQSRDLCCFCGVAFCKKPSRMQWVLTGPCYGQLYSEGQHPEQSNGSFALIPGTNFSWGLGDVCLFILALEHSSWKRMHSATQ